jgi:hypothetical protein
LVGFSRCSVAAHPKHVTGKEVCLRRVATAAIAMALLVPLPGSAAGAEGVMSGAPLVKIGGPAKLKAARVLEFPVYCSRPCFVKVTVKLLLPGPNLVLTDATTIQPGRPKVDRLKLNRPATVALKENYREARLEVIARARNLETGARAVARRTFKFHL